MDFEIIQSGGAMSSRNISVVFVIDQPPAAAIGEKFKSLMELAELLLGAGYRVAFASYSLDQFARAAFDDVADQLKISDLAFFGLYEYIEACAQAGVGVIESPLQKSGEPCCLAREMPTTDIAVCEATTSQAEGCSKTVFRIVGDDSPFLVFLNDENAQVTHTAWRDSKGFYHEFQGDSQLYECWFAYVENQMALSHGQQQRGVVFVCESHERDEALFDNRFTRNKPCVVAVVHGTIFKRPYSYDAPLNKAKRYLQWMDKYSVLAVHTARQREHIANMFGDRDNLIVVKPFCNVPVIPGATERNRGAFAIAVSKVGIDGAKDALVAVSAIRDRCPNAHLDIYASKKNASLLREAAKGLGVEDAVHFYRRENFLKNNVEYEATLSLLPYSGTDSALLTSLSHGIPVIAYDCLYGPRDVMDQKAGILVRPSDVEGLSMAMHAMAKRGLFKRRAMSKAAKACAQAFDREAVLRSWETLLDKAIEKAAAKNASIGSNRSIAFGRFQVAQASKGADASGDALTLVVRAYCLDAYCRKEGCDEEPDVTLRLSMTYYMPDGESGFFARYAKGRIVNSSGQELSVQFDIDNSEEGGNQLDFSLGRFVLWAESDGGVTSYDFEWRDILPRVPQTWGCAPSKH